MANGARVTDFGKYVKMDQDTLERAMQEVDQEIDSLRAEKEVIGRGISMRASEASARAILGEMSQEQRDAMLAVLQNRA